MFFTKKRINDKNEKNYQSNLSLHELNQSTKTKVKILEVIKSKGPHNI